MKVLILEAFEAYPEGARETYPAGATLDLPDDFAGRIIAKGHAAPIEAAPKVSKSSSTKKETEE